MRRVKTVARILLIFSIANVVLAAPALVRQRRLVTDRADNGPTDEPEAARESLAGSVYQNEVVPAAPPSEPASEHGTPPESEQDSKLGSSDVPVPQDRVRLPPISEVGPAHGSPAGSENIWELEPLDGSVRQDPVTYSYHSKYEWPEEDYLFHSAPDQGFAPNSPSGLHQDSAPESPSGYKALQSHVYRPVATGPRLLNRPIESWLHTGDRPPTWEAGGSSNSAGESSQTVGKLSQTPEKLPPAVESGLHQDSAPELPSGYKALQSHDDLPVESGPRLLDRPFESWLHPGDRPPTWEAGESSNSAGESSQTVGKVSQTVPPETLPPAVEAQPSHDEKSSWWHELYQFVDVDLDVDQDQGSNHKFWGSDAGSEVEQKLFDESHLRD